MPKKDNVCYMYVLIITIEHIHMYSIYQLSLILIVTYPKKFIQVIIYLVYQYTKATVEIKFINEKLKQELWSNYVYE